MSLRRVFDNLNELFYQGPSDIPDFLMGGDSPDDGSNLGVDEWGEQRKRRKKEKKKRKHKDKHAKHRRKDKPGQPSGDAARWMDIPDDPSIREDGFSSGGSSSGSNPNSPSGMEVKF